MGDNQGGHNLNSTSSNLDNSLVKRITSRVSDILPTSLSKWLPIQVSRRRESDSNDISEVQSPAKRLRGNEVPVNPQPISYSDRTPLYSRSCNAECSSVPNTEVPQTKMNGHPYRFDNEVAGPSGLQKTSKIWENQSNVETEKSETEKLPEVLSNCSTNNSEVGSESLPKINSSYNKFLSTSRLNNSSRSLFSYLSPQQPSFSPSSLVDRTLSSEKKVHSPFYQGRTAFGGASAYRTPIRRNITPIQRVRTTTTARCSTGLSQTARRILNTLEHFSSPPTEARKPTKTTTPYSRPPLCVPSVSDVLRMKHIERIRQSTESARQTVYRITADDKSSMDNNNKNTSRKIKTKLSKVRPEKELEAVEEVKLPDIALPITTLPKFDFLFPNKPEPKMNETKSSICKLKQNEKKVETITRNTDNVKKSCFEFSRPILLDNNGFKSITSINNFVFSKPLYVNKDNNKHLDDKTIVIEKPDNKFTFNSLQQNTNTKVKNVSNKNDNLLDKFKPAPNTWECKTCLIRNKEDALKCVACETVRSDSKTVPTVESKNCFGDKFKLTTDKWECPSCLVRNNNSDLKCGACTTSKPGTTSPKSVSILENKVVTGYGFGDKFKPQSDTWECKVCMIRNKLNTDKCVACNAENPSNIKKTEEKKWECPSCMVYNEPTKLKCVCCETAKPGAKIDTKVSTIAPTGTAFKFGIDKVDKSAEGKKWECPSCMVYNEPSKLKCVCCETAKPGEKIVSKVPTIAPTGMTFKFGIDKVDKSTEQEKKWECPSCMVYNEPSKLKCVCCETVKPGEKVNMLTPIKPIESTFKFGIDKASDEKKWECSSCMVYNEPTKLKCVCCETSKPGAKIESKPTIKSPPQTTFKFGIDKVDVNSVTPSAVNNFIFGTKPSENNTNKVDKPSNGFVFGAQPNKSLGADQKSQGFTFGMQNTNSEVKSPLKSDGFGDKFKPKSNTWECNACMIRNENNVDKCVACSTNKAGTNPTKIESQGEKKIENGPTAPSFKFGNVNSNATLNNNFMLGNTGNEINLIEKKESKSGNFSFGTKQTNGPLREGFTLGAQTKTEKTAVEMFGAPASKQTAIKPTSFETGKVNDTVPAASVPSFSLKPANSTFNSPNNTGTPYVFGFGASASDNNSTKSTKKLADLPGFSTFSSPAQNDLTNKTYFSNSKFEFKPNNGIPSLNFGSNPTFSENKIPSITNPKNMFEMKPPEHQQPSTVPNGLSAFNSQEVKPSGFKFNPVPFEAPAQGQTFQFGKPAPSIFTFGAPKTETPSTSQTQNSSFASTAANMPVFSFGTNSNDNSAKPFGVGPTKSEPVVSGGFSFGSTNQTASPAFDSNNKPVLSFTADRGASAFASSTTTGSTVGPQRRMKKAIRRTQR